MSAALAIVDDGPRETHPAPSRTRLKLASTTKTHAPYDNPIPTTDTLAQLKNRINYSDTFIVSQHDYSHDGVGNRKTALDKLGVYVPPAVNDTYTYDPLGNRRSRNDGVTQTAKGVRLELFS